MNRTLQLAGYEPGVRTGPAVELRHLEDREGLADIAELRTPSEAHLEAVAKVLAGRRLSTREVERFMEQKLPGAETSVADCLAWLTASGRVRQMPGVQRGAFGRLRCPRCGETDRARAWDCAVCGEERCWVCEACRSLGPVRSCTVLYAAPVDTAAAPAVHGGSASLGEADGVVLLAPTLTPAQKKASDALVSFVRGSREDALVWAVCGAGKTEMCFAAVAAELVRGGRVLFAVPRRDVVRELGPRLRAAFPHVQLQVLHGARTGRCCPCCRRAR